MEVQDRQLELLEQEIRKEIDELANVYRQAETRLYTTHQVQAQDEQELEVLEQEMEVLEREMEFLEREMRWGLRKEMAELAKTLVKPDQLDNLYRQTATCLYTTHHIRERLYMFIRHVEKLWVGIGDDLGHLSSYPLTVEEAAAILVSMSAYNAGIVPRPGASGLAIQTDGSASSFATHQAPHIASELSDVINPSGADQEEPLPQVKGTRHLWESRPGSMGRLLKQRAVGRHAARKLRTA